MGTVVVVVVVIVVGCGCGCGSSSRCGSYRPCCAVPCRALPDLSCRAMLWYVAVLCGAVLRMRHEHLLLWNICCVALGGLGCHAVLLLACAALVCWAARAAAAHPPTRV
jgi:hypothetical protein